MADTTALALMQPADCALGFPVFLAMASLLPALLGQVPVNLELPTLDSRCPMRCQGTLPLLDSLLLDSPVVKLATGRGYVDSTFWEEAWGQGLSDGTGPPGLVGVHHVLWYIKVQRKITLSITSRRRGPAGMLSLHWCCHESLVFHADYF